MGGLSLLQGIFPTQELNWGLPHCRQILYQLSYEGSSGGQQQTRSLVLTFGMAFSASILQVLSCTNIFQVTKWALSFLDPTHHPEGTPVSETPGHPGSLGAPAAHTCCIIIDPPHPLRRRPVWTWDDEGDHEHHEEAGEQGEEEGRGAAAREAGLRGWRPAGFFSCRAPRVLQHLPVLALQRVDLGLQVLAVHHRVHIPEFTSRPLWWRQKERRSAAGMAVARQPGQATESITAPLEKGSEPGRPWSQRQQAPRLPPADPGRPARRDYSKAHVKH